MKYKAITAFASVLIMLIAAFAMVSIGPVSIKPVAASAPNDVGDWTTYYYTFSAGTPLTQLSRENWTTVVTGASTKYNWVEVNETMRTMWYYGQGNVNWNYVIRQEVSPAVTENIYWSWTNSQLTTGNSIAGKTLVDVSGVNYTAYTTYNYAYEMMLDSPLNPNPSGSSPLFNYANPLGTNWAELSPIPGGGSAPFTNTQWNLTSWTGWTPGDSLSIKYLPAGRNMTGWVLNTNVERLAVTLYLVPSSGPSIYIDSLTPAQSFTWNNPMSSSWEEAYPTLHSPVTMTTWTNVTGNANYPTDTTTVNGTVYTVSAVGTDLLVTTKPNPGEGVNPPIGMTWTSEMYTYTSPVSETSTSWGVSRIAGYKGGVKCNVTGALSKFFCYNVSSVDRASGYFGWSMSSPVVDGAVTSYDSSTFKGVETSSFWKMCPCILLEMEGDVTGAKSISALDIGDVGIALFSSPGSPYWNGRCAVAGGTSISALDIGDVGIYLFSHC
jgi:hypothetical protein